MAMILDMYTLPVAQRYVEVIQSNAVSHLGMNGVMSRDVRVGQPINTRRIQIGWEAMTAYERDIITAAWKFLIDNETADFTDVHGNGWTARLPSNDRAFRWSAYEGCNDESGPIQALFDIIVVLELS